MSGKFQFDSPEGALVALLEQIQPVGTERVTWSDAVGRVLAEPLLSDRDNPPCDVSAMDGYAVRLRDLNAGPLSIAGDVPIGSAPPELPAGMVLRMVTGAAVPPGAEAVIPREDVQEMPDCITLRNPQVPSGQHIRRRGENLPAGQVAVPAGSLLHAPLLAAVASFGAAQLCVHRKVRVGVLVTGDELLPIDSAPQPWQIRDSNGPTLLALLAGCPRVAIQTQTHAPDVEDCLKERLGRILDQCDLVLLTGGVSMGNRDHVPAAVQALGSRIIFHKLPVRPGKPVLGAIGPTGQVILGLPGNPVSVMTTACRIAGPALRHLSGVDRTRAEGCGSLAIVNPDALAISMWWSRLVQTTGPGTGQLLPNRGSGDIVAAARSDGFVEIPPGQSGAGPWPFYRWEL